MGCSGSRGKNKNQDNFYFKIINCYQLQIQLMEEYDKTKVRFIQLKVNKQFLTEESDVFKSNVLDENKVEYEDKIRIQDFEGQKVQVQLELIQVDSHSFKQKKNNKTTSEKFVSADDSWLPLQTPLNQVLAIGALDISKAINNPSVFQQQYIELLTSNKKAKIVGGIYIQFCFFPLLPSAQQFQQAILNQKQKASIEPSVCQFQLRNMVTLVQQDLNTIEWAPRGGHISIEVKGLKLNEVIKRYGQVQYQAVIEIGHNSLIASTEKWIQQDPQQYQIDNILFNPINPNLSLFIKIFKGLQDPNNQVACFKVDLLPVFKKHGHWAISQSFYSLNLDPTIKIKPIIHLSIKFNYNISYPIYSIPNQLTILNKLSNYKRGLLEVNILKLRNLYSVDPFDQGSILIEFYMNNNRKNKHLTQVINEYQDSDWKVKRKINLKTDILSKEDKILIFNVWDRDICSQELIGNVEIDLFNIIQNGNWIDGWFKLSNKQYHDKSIGEIYLQIGYTAKGTKYTQKSVPKY